MVGSRLGHSNYAMIEFSILGEIRRGVSRATTLPLHLLKGFSLFRSLVDRVLEGKGVQEGWTFFKKEILKERSRPPPMTLYVPASALLPEGQ